MLWYLPLLRAEPLGMFTEVEFKVGVPAEFPLDFLYPNSPAVYRAMWLGYSSANTPDQPYITVPELEAVVRDTKDYQRALHACWAKVAQEAQYLLWSAASRPESRISQLSEEAFRQHFRNRGIRARELGCWMRRETALYSVYTDLVVVANPQDVLALPTWGHNSQESWQENGGDAVLRYGLAILDERCVASASMI